MVRYICAIFIVALPILIFLYNGWIMSLAYDYTHLKMFSIEITSSTFFLVNCFVLAITFLACMTLAIEIWDSQKNCNVPKTYYIEAELIAKDATTVFKVTDNGNKVTYYETDINLNIADNGNYKNNYMLLMSDNTTREDKTDDIILAVYNTVGEFVEEH